MLLPVNLPTSSLQSAGSCLTPSTAITTTTPITVKAGDVHHSLRTDMTGLRSDSTAAEPFVSPLVPKSRVLRRFPGMIIHLDPFNTSFEPAQASAPSTGPPILTSPLRHNDVKLEGNCYTPPVDTQPGHRKLAPLPQRRKQSPREIQLAQQRLAQKMDGLGPQLHQALGIQKDDGEQASHTGEPQASYFAPGPSDAA